MPNFSDKIHLAVATGQVWLIQKHSHDGDTSLYSPKRHQAREGQTIYFVKVTGV